MMDSNRIIGLNDSILITGAAGFIGSKVVETLLSYGYRNLSCLVRETSNTSHLETIIKSYDDANVKIFKGNMLSREDCNRASAGASVIYNLVAGMEKSFPGCFMNSVVTLRNLLDSIAHGRQLKRLVHVSSFAVYSNLEKRRGEVLDETCMLESKFMERSDAYCYGKVKQEELLEEYGKNYHIPYVIVRPGVPYGPGVKTQIHARIGIAPFGIFFHLGGSNRIPFTYIDNCAEAIVLAGVKKGVDGKAFNIVDDNLPTSGEYLNQYKKNVGHVKSIYIPYWLFHAFSNVWQKYSKWSNEQLPPAFNTRKCAALWKGNRYPNTYLKNEVGWEPRVSLEEGMKKHFAHLRKVEGVE
jgi:nucleoside-diphosphate-sugar epimerase